ISNAIPVNNYAAGDSQLVQHIYCQRQVVETEGSGLSHQQAEITTPYRLDYGAGGSRRDINNGKPFPVDMPLHLSDYGGSHRLADSKLAVDKLNPF
ncbi:unnamed protein product, partial [marine sediment metagenome]